jgi:hypothetical protein
MTSRTANHLAIALVCAVGLVGCAAATPSAGPATAAPVEPSAAQSEAPPPSAAPSEPAASEPAASAPAAVFPLDIVDAEGKSHRFEQPVANVGCGNYLCLDTLADLGIVASGVSTPDEGEYNGFYHPQGLPAMMDIDGWNPEAWAPSGSEIILVRVAEPDDREKALDAVADVVYLYAPAYSREPPFGSEARHPGRPSREGARGRAPDRPARAVVRGRDLRDAQGGRRVRGPRGGADRSLPGVRGRLRLRVR